MVPLGVLLAVFALYQFPRLPIRHSLTIGLLIILQLIGVTRLAARDSTGMVAWNWKEYQEGFLPETAPSAFSWFEEHNRVHMRDIPTIQYLEQVVERVVVRTGTANIMSIQMGMVSYHLVKQYHGRVDVTDLRGLTDDRIADCSVFHDLPRRTTGIQIKYQYFFDHQQRIAENCGIRAPDIIFDLLGRDDGRIDRVRRNGYTVVYTQDGSISVPGLFDGNDVSGRQFIAVRSDLLYTLHDLPPLHLEYPLTSSPGKGSDL
jgi:hypothetical protein